MLALAVLLMVVMTLSTVHLGVLIGQEILKPPEWSIPVQGFLEIFGYFLLIGVELLETLKAYVRKERRYSRARSTGSGADCHGSQSHH